MRTPARLWSSLVHRGRCRAPGSGSQPRRCRPRATPCPLAGRGPARPRSLIASSQRSAPAPLRPPSWGSASADRCAGTTPHLFLPHRSRRARSSFPCRAGAAPLRRPAEAARRGAASNVGRKRAWLRDRAREARRAVGSPSSAEGSPRVLAAGKYVAEINVDFAPRRLRQHDRDEIQIQEFTTQVVCVCVARFLGGEKTTFTSPSGRATPPRQPPLPLRGRSCRNQLLRRASRRRWPRRRTGSSESVLSREQVRGYAH